MSILQIGLLQCLHIWGEPAVSGIKWIGSKYNNPIKRNMERASALIILNNPETNFPVAILEGSVISSMRTAAVTVVASQHLAKKKFLGNYQL